MKKLAIEAIHNASIDTAGANAIIDVTLADGTRRDLVLPYEKLGLAVQALLVANQQALIARHDAGTLDALAHMQRFTLQSLSVERLPNHVGLALTLKGGGVLPVAIPLDLAREFGTQLLAAADHRETPGPARH